MGPSRHRRKSPPSSTPPSAVADAESGLLHRGGRLRQQTLPSHTSIFSPRTLITLYFCTAVLALPFGGLVLSSSSRVSRTRPIAYGTAAACAVGRVFNRTKACSVEFRVPDTIPAPSYLYYSLKNFHQNARKYARSRSYRQLRGQTPKSIIFIQDCKPILYKPGSTNGTNGFDVTEFVIPCGLTAWSRFNDTFTLCRGEAGGLCEPVPLRKRGIAWQADVTKKFKRGDSPEYTDTVNNLLEDEDFMVWMRLSTFKNFDKLYRIIDEDLAPGTYHMQIENNFPVESFYGEKLFHISNMAWFGDRNYFLGIVMTVVGVLALLIATALLARDFVKPRTQISQNPEQLLTALARLNCEFAESNLIVSDSD